MNIVPITRLFLLTIIFSSLVSAYGQKNICGSIINWKELKADPKKYDAFMQNEKWIAERIKQSKYNLQDVREYDIPVVFHIVLADPTIVTDQMIFDQVNNLNNYFQGVNPDLIPDYFSNLKGGVKFRFVLAKQTPEGCSTNGITRTSNATPFSEAEYSKIKHAPDGADQWVSYNSHYLNIWVGASDDLFGIAALPENVTDPKPENEQGVVINFETVTRTGLETRRMQKTLVHEVGHFFNLFHIWGPYASDIASCSDTDFVDDTPNQSIASTGTCPTGTVYDACSPSPSTYGFMYQNFMDYTNDPCRVMFTIGQAKRMMQSLEYPNRRNLIATDNNALKPASPIETFTTCNAPAFTTNAFKTITVGKNGVVWAATGSQGLYQYNKGAWRKWNLAPYNTVNYQDMKADQAGTIWIAESGTSGIQSTNGGIISFTDTTLTSYKYYTPIANGIPSRSARSIFVDTSRYNNEFFNEPLVWTAHYATSSSGTNVSGGIGRGIDVLGSDFSIIRSGIDTTNGTGGVFCIGGNADTIWSFTGANPAVSNILVHDAKTNKLITTLTGNLVSSNFQARGIYFDAKGNKWITVLNEGLLVNDSNGVWRKIAFPELFTASPVFYANAITGDTSGNVFIGTNNGLIVHLAGYPIGDLSGYKRYSTANGLPSNNILGICVDTLRRKLLIATDNGIAFWNPSCTDANIYKVYYTTSAGNVDATTTWCQGEVPPPNAEIVVKHPITINTNTTLKKVTVVSPGSVSVSAGVNYNITGH